MLLALEERGLVVVLSPFSVTFDSVFSRMALPKSSGRVIIILVGGWGTKRQVSDFEFSRSIIGPKIITMHTVCFYTIIVSFFKPTFLPFLTNFMAHFVQNKLFHAKFDVIWAKTIHLMPKITMRKSPLGTLFETKIAYIQQCAVGKILFLLPLQCNENKLNIGSDS